MTNVTAFHGQGAVHLGGHEMSNGRWSPACGTQHHNVGGREMTPLRPTDKAVTCKRCLKLIEKNKQAEAVEARRQQAKAAIAKPKPSAGSPAVDEHAAAVARMRANREAEEEERAAARRARNRTAYATAPHPVGRKLAKDHGLNFF
jgi:hypothetical protein